MSTKIYNAYKFNGTIEELIQHIRDYKTTWIDYHVDRLRSSKMTKMIKEDGYNFLDLIDIMKEHSQKKYPTHRDFFDVRGSVWVGFFEGNIYVQSDLNDKHYPFEKDIESFIDDRFVDYHYQNQSDPWYTYRDDLTEAEVLEAEKDYTERGRIWDAIMQNDHSLIQCGLTFEYMSQESDYYEIVGRYHNLLQEKK